MSHVKAPYSLRIKRIVGLAGCLFSSMRTLNSLNRATLQQRNEALTRISSSAMRALGIKLNVTTPPQHFNVQGTLIAANHVSWLDIFALSALYPSSFIAKQEISRWPFFGKMGRNAGTVFINRNSRKDIDPINAAISEALVQGQNVSFFPETKTTSGNSVLPFKAALFQAAINSCAPVQAIALRYYDGEHRTVAPSYAGSINLLKSLWRIVSVPELHIRIDFAPLIETAGQTEQDRFSIKDTAESFISAKVAEDSPDLNMPKE